MIHVPPKIGGPKPIRSGRIRVHPIWADSLGAKTFATLVETPDLRILIDPGAAEMQPSFPFTERQRTKVRQRAISQLRQAARTSDMVVITHYHYDHYLMPSEGKRIYQGKEIWVKNPNLWINGSQWKRARLFFEALRTSVLRTQGPDSVQPDPKVTIPHPMAALAEARKKSFGDYQERRQELLAKGHEWFEGLCRQWRSGPWIPEAADRRTRVRFADGQVFHQGKTIVRFTPPLFHGIEYARVGWVVAVAVEYGRAKVLYTSDIQGPTIEDYATWIIRENPDVLLLDGPPTYLYGFLVNRINLLRSVKNLIRILRRTTSRIILLDHHLLREARYRERIAEVYTEVERTGRQVLTVAEWYGQRPIVLEMEQD
jgi:predicted metallo-beta-lactamase superfamily hydrolase